MASVLEVILKATDQASGVVRGVTNTLRVHSQQWRDVSRGLAVGGAAVTTAILAAVRTTQRYGEELDKASKITGVAASELSRLRFAAEQEHASFEGLTTSLRFLSRAMVEATDRTSESGRIFAALGISVTDAQGRMRNAADVLLELSDVFAGMEDDTQRTALAMKLLGRAGTELIPFLRQGRGAIEAMKREADRLGVTMSDDAARAAKRFGDELTSLRASVRGVVVQIGLAAMPTVQDLVKRATEAAASVSAWAREHPELVRQLITTTAMAGGLALVLGTIGLVLPKVAIGFGLLKAAAIAASGPIGLAAIMIGAVVAGLSAEAKERDRLIRAQREGIITHELAVRALKGEEAARKVALALIRDHEQAQRTKQQADETERLTTELSTRANALSAEILKKLQAALAGTDREKRSGITLTELMTRATDRWREREEALAGTIDDTGERLEEQVRVIADAVARYEVIRARIATTREEKERLTDVIEGLKNRLIGLNAELARHRRELERGLRQHIFDDITKALGELQEAVEAGDVQRVRELAELYRGLLEPAVLQRFIEAAERQQTINERLREGRIAAELYQQALREVTNEERDRQRMLDFDRTRAQEDEERLNRELQLLQRRLELIEDPRARREAEAAGLTRIIVLILDQIAANERLIASYREAGLPVEALVEANKRLAEMLGAVEHRAALVAQSLKTSFTRVLVEIREGFEEAFATLFRDVLTNARTFGEALLGFFRSIVNAIISMLAQLAARWFIGLLFGGFARGGLIQGGLAPLAALAGGGALRGGSLMPLVAAQAGFLARRPTLALVAETPAAQPEIITPEPQMRRTFREELDRGGGRPVDVTVRVINVFDRSQLPQPDPEEMVATVVNDIATGGSIEKVIRRRFPRVS